MRSRATLRCRLAASRRCQLPDTAGLRDQFRSEQMVPMRRPVLMLHAMMRRLAAALIAIVIGLAPLLGAFEPAAAATAGRADAVRHWSGAQADMPKPCKKAVLPGAISTCPFAGAGVTALPPSEDLTAQPIAAARTLTWRPHDAALSTQCHASSPYRPPCRLS